MTVGLALQEHVVAGASLEEKFETAQAWGFSALELRGKGEGIFASRLPELKRAKAAGVRMETLCVEMLHFVCDFDPDLREDAIVQLTQQLETFAEIGGKALVTPASYGLFSKRLPPFVPPRSPAEDHKVLTDSFGILAERAKQLGIVVAIEPLNRYEDYLINSFQDAAKLIDQIGLDSLRICADTYHMNIEQARPLEDLRDYRKYIAHVQLSDTNRLEPGAGHFDWKSLLEELAGWELTVTPAYECRLSGEPEVVLPESARFLAAVS